MLSLLKVTCWPFLLFFIFLRPFICEQAFPFLGLYYIFGLIFFCLFNLLVNLGSYQSVLSRPLNLSVFFFAALVFIFQFFLKFAPPRIYELYLFLPNILIFLIAGGLDQERKGQLIKVIFAAAVFIGIYTIYQYFFGLKHLESYLNTHPEGLPYAPDYLKMILARKRPFATFISPNVFASYLLMMIFIGWGLFLEAGQGANSQGFGEKASLAIATFIIFIALILTKSLAAFLVLFFTLPMFLIFIWGKNSRYLLKISRPKIILAVIGFVSLAGLAIFISRSRIAQLTIFSDPNNSLLQRNYYWRTALRIISAHPLIGVGWRNFEIFYNTYRFPEANFSSYAHNLFLQIFAETGVIGLLSFLAVVFIFFKNGLVFLNNERGKNFLGTGIFFAGIAFLLHNLFDVSFYFGQSVFFWWIILGSFNPLRRDA